MLLLKENNKKAGVYCLVNLVNGHTYIGSSTNLASRMRNYLNNSFLKSINNKNMPISKALLKYGHNNFAVLIIEYVDPNVINIRATHWMTKLLPYYNVLKQGYSSVGYKHTMATRNLLSELAKNKTHSENTKYLIAKALTGENNPMFGKTHTEETKLKMTISKSTSPVYIYNSLRQLLLIYPSVKTLADVIATNSATVVSFITKGALFRGG